VASARAASGPAWSTLSGGKPAADVAATIQESWDALK
jgi:hypothetical protein